nr:PREDICTED: uncharacterized protein LOC107078859 [Lepisosteus oculatus]XP_015215054.1 PREDICTED: uncharacterized protein LOC107078859 [Lepisosteus oculatus]XP_015215055.1 PREDICTED: uncharacterized protein LOC107078859 [Lepisosteus oculatus]
MYGKQAQRRRPFPTDRGEQRRGTLKSQTGGTGRHKPDTSCVSSAGDSNVSRDASWRDVPPLLLASQCLSCVETQGAPAQSMMRRSRYSSCVCERCPQAGSGERMSALVPLGPRVARVTGEETACEQCAAGEVALAPGQPCRGCQRPPQRRAEKVRAGLVPVSSPASPGRDPSPLTLPQGEREGEGRLTGSTSRLAERGRQVLGSSNIPGTGREGAEEDACREAWKTESEDSKATGIAFRERDRCPLESVKERVIFSTDLSPGKLSRGSSAAQGVCVRLLAQDAHSLSPWAPRCLCPSWPPVSLPFSLSPPV